MSRLTLSKKLHRILRIDSNLPGTYPTTTVGQTGLLGEIVGFIDDAYEGIQTLEDQWEFRQKQSTFNLTSGTAAYSRATIAVTITDYDAPLAFLSGGCSHVFVYLTATGVSDTTKCLFLPYAQFRGQYDQGTIPTGKPQYFTVQPDQSLKFYPTPDATYTVALDYRRTLHVWTLDADEPLFAADYANAIVYGGVLEWCETRDGAADAKRAKYQPKYENELARLRGKYLPEITWDCTTFYGGSW